MRLSVPKPFVSLQKGKVRADEIVARLEPQEKIDLTSQLSYLYADDPAMRSQRDSDPRPYR